MSAILILLAAAAAFSATTDTAADRPTDEIIVTVQHTEGQDIPAVGE